MQGTINGTSFTLPLLDLHVLFAILSLKCIGMGLIHYHNSKSERNFGQSYSRLEEDWNYQYLNNWYSSFSIKAHSIYESFSIYARISLSRNKEVD